LQVEVFGTEKSKGDNQGLMDRILGLVLEHGLRSFSVFVFYLSSFSPASVSWKSVLEMTTTFVTDFDIGRTLHNESIAFVTILSMVFLTKIILKPCAEPRCCTCSSSRGESASRSDGNALVGAHKADGRVHFGAG
jgi:hypothetical protein